ncbi:hypothetical protein N9L47_01810 [Rhodobacteraceae bacterium]|nr:hypothetical protein [Paracoccaceae bacterium]
MGKFVLVTVDGLWLQKLGNANMSLNTNNAIALAANEPEIVPDRRKLSAGAAAIRDKFSPDQHNEIKKAKPLSYTNAMLSLEDHGHAFAMQDIQLGVLIAGMEKSGESEVTITNLMNNLRAAWPQLEKRWLKDLRKAVQYLLGSERRAAARGLETNIVNEHDYLQLCSYGAKKVEKDNCTNPTMFRRGSTLAAVTTIPELDQTRIETLDQKKFTAKLNLIAPYRQSFQAGDDVIIRGVSVPLDVANQLFVHEHNIPHLNGLITAPVFSEDCDLINSPGFNEKTGIFYAKPMDLKIPTVPRNVTSSDVDEAKRILTEELLGDFELDGVSRDALLKAALGSDPSTPPPASFLNAVGLLVEQFVRPMIKGPLMLNLITKTVNGSGGGLLSNAIGYIVDGRPSSRPMANNEEERRKAITSALRSGTRMICWDNVTGDLSSAALASVTTEPIWNDRILGRSSEASIPVTSSFVIVGNRPLLSDELRRRTSLIEMKPQTANPEERSGFRHESLMGYVKKHRGDFVWATLVLALNWIQKGCPEPKHAPIIGSYEAYRYVIGGIIEVASESWTTWQQNRSALNEIASDGEEEEIENLLAAWWSSCLSPDGAEAPELCAIAEAEKIALPIKRVPLGGEHEFSTRSMGRYLKTFVGRHFEMEDGTTVELCQSQKRGKGGYPWKLSKVEKKPGIRDAAKAAPSEGTKIAFERPAKKNHSTSILKAANTNTNVADPFK